MSRRLSASSPRASTAASPSKSLISGAADEITPLLRKASRSLSNTFYGESRPIHTPESDEDSEGTDDEVDGQGGREVEVYIPGKSTFLQTLLNCLADIVGTGLLACPIAIAHLGWVLGPVMLVITGLISLWTLKIMLRIIEKDRRLRSFTDVIGYGLGPIGEKITTGLFFAEFGIWVIALVVLFSDTLAVVWPIFSSDECKLVGLLAILPTSFLPLRYLAFSSGLGVVSTISLVGILIFSGIATPNSPGSLRDPAPTDLWPTHGLAKGIVALGLLISGFGGHGLIPNLIRDMRHPKQADRMCECAYGIAMVIYLLVSVCGYLMYGRNVSDEISKDLAQTPGFSPMLNNIAVWMVALNPLTKIPLGLRPFSDILFSYLHLHPTILIPESQKTPHVTRPSSLLSIPSSLPDVDDAEHLLSQAAERQHHRRERAKYFLRPVIRLVLAVLVTVGALVMPSFESSMAILGGGFGVVMMVVLPVWAGGKVLGWKPWYTAVIVGSLVFAAIGTGAAVVTARDRTNL